MKPHGTLRATGGGLLGIGMALLVPALDGQAALLGVAMACVATGVALLGNARAQGCGR